MITRLTATIRRSLAVIALTDLALLATVGALCGVGGWHTARDFTHGLTYAALAVMLLGTLPTLSSASPAINPAFGYQPLDADEQRSTVQRIISERDGAFGFMVRMVTAGFVLLLLGQLLSMVA